MSRIAVLTLTMGFIAACTPGIVSAQFPTKLPRIPKAEKPKSDPPTTAGNSSTSDRVPTGADSSGSRPGATANSKKIYVDLHSDSTAVLVKDSVYIQAVTHDSYWKAPNQRNYSSWVPTLRFSLFYDNNKDLNLVAEYTNPDGSPWFTDVLDHDNYKPEPEHGEVGYRSKDSFQMLETKSTVAIGAYGIKITNRDNGAVVFQGKFKVNKFRWDDNPQDKNKVDFFVDHDWLLPIGYVGFAENIGFDVGAKPVEVSVWLKGEIKPDELEGRIFYKSQQVATTAGPGGLAVSDSTEIITKHSVFSADVHTWKLWHFQWQKTLLYSNGGEFNPADYPGAFFADKNPGDYIVKVYRKGAQLRELKFTIGSDGRFVDAGYARPLFLAKYKVIVPVKVAAEKWDAVSWKTDAFYGNPPAGFSVP